MPAVGQPHAGHVPAERVAFDAGHAGFGEDFDACRFGFRAQAVHQRLPAAVQIQDALRQRHLHLLEGGAGALPVRVVGVSRNPKERLRQAARVRVADLRLQPFTHRPVIDRLRLHLG